MSDIKRCPANAWFKSTEQPVACFDLAGHPGAHFAADGRSWTNPVLPEPAPVVEQCATCRFYEAWDATYHGGNCRRRAPVLFDHAQHPDDQHRGSFPGVADIGWCGEYEVRRV